MTTDKIPISGYVYYDHEQWHLMLEGNGSILDAISQRMNEQTFPAVLIQTGSIYACGTEGLGHTTSLSFSTWGGGSFGGPAKYKKRRRIVLKKIKEPKS